MKFPKLKRTQWLGLVVVILFGGRLALMLTEKKDPDVLPSGVRLSDLPSPKIDLPDLNPVPAEPLKVGSQEAKDMLYCSGVISAENKAKPDGKDALPRLTAALALANAGRRQLESEGAVQGFGAIAVDSAWGDKAAADYADGKPAISLSDCMKKADALSPPPPDPNAPKPEDLTLKGSQAAKDDLYCAGVISAEFDHKKDVQHPDDMSKQIAAMRALDEAGLAKLRAEKVATEQDGAGYSLAFTAKANADYEAGQLRMSFADCMKRSATVPPAN